MKLYEFSNSWTGTIIIVLLVIFFVAQAFVIPSGSMKSTLLIGDHLFVKKFSYGVPIPHIPYLETPVLPDINKNGHLLSADGPKRGDIVVFRYPGNEKTHYVKRNVAVGGDEILYTTKTLFLRPHEGDWYIKKNYPKNKIVSLNGKLWVKNPYLDKYPGIHYDEYRDLFSTMAERMRQNRLSMTPYYAKELPQIDPSFDFNTFYKKIAPVHYFMMGDNRDHSDDSRFWGSVPYRLIVGKPWFVYFSWVTNNDEFIKNLDTTQLNEQTKKEFKLSSDINSGVVIANVQKNSSAYIAGFKQGDVIFKIKAKERVGVALPNGKIVERLIDVNEDIDDIFDFKTFLNDNLESIEISVHRNGKQEPVVITNEKNEFVPRWDRFGKFVKDIQIDKNLLSAR